MNIRAWRIKRQLTQVQLAKKLRLTQSLWSKMERGECRLDIVQLGLITLSVLLGRRLTPDDYPADLETLLDEVEESAGRRSPAPLEPARLRCP